MTTHHPAQPLKQPGQAPQPPVLPLQHPGEPVSNDIRRRLLEVEPHSIRTFTPSGAVLARSAGSYHWTPEGRKLADFTSGVLVMNLGHNPTRWWRRVHEYMGLNKMAEEEGEFFESVTLNAYNAITDLETVCCERLVALLQSQPGGARCEQVLWAASGSEAVQKAMWAALDRREGEDIILSTRHGFHGKKGLSNAITGSEADKERDPRVRFISFPREECASLERRREPLDLAPYEAELQALWEEYGNRICCVVTEPYLGGGGSFHPQKNYIQLLERFCREHDVLFVLDEVQANFGRTGSLFAFTEYGVEPDLVVLGKGLGNGVAVSAVVGRRDVFSRMHYGEASDTWSANPLASAAVLATLDEFADGDVLRHAAALSRVLEEGLLRLRESGAVAHVRGEGVVWGVECAAVGTAPADAVARMCVEACYRGDAEGRGVHLLGPLSGRVIRVSPPLVMPLKEAREYLGVMLERFSSVARKLAGGSAH